MIVYGYKYISKDQACQTLFDDIIRNQASKQIQTDNIVNKHYDRNAQTENVGKIDIAI